MKDLLGRLDGAGDRGVEKSCLVTEACFPISLSAILALWVKASEETIREFHSELLTAVRATA